MQARARYPPPPPLATAMVRRPYKLAVKVILNVGNLDVFVPQPSAVGNSMLLTRPIAPDSRTGPPQNESCHHLASSSSSSSSVLLSTLELSDTQSL